jgi:hypothetical protein
MNRIINAKPHLENLLKEEDQYYVGFGVRNLTTDGIHYRDLQELIKGNIEELTVMGSKSPLKENVHGKWIRKEPEEKESVITHIDYVNKHGTRVKYDRTYSRWIKVILHKYKLALRKVVTPQNEVILHFPMFLFKNENEHYLYAKAAINISLYLGGYYQIYDKNFEPVVPLTAALQRKILDKGSGRSVEEKLEVLRELVFNDSDKNDENSGNSYRFAVLKEFKITDVYSGIGGFNEYFQFEFADDDILIFENLRVGNATYICKLPTFNALAGLDKQNIKTQEGFITWVRHTNLEKWRSELEKFLKAK